MKGRPPKSTAQHKKDGTYNATKHRDRLTFPPLSDIPNPPDYFTDNQKSKWVLICNLLKRNDMLADTYLELLERYCNAWQTWWRAQQEVDATGITFTTDSGQTKQNPAVAIEKEMLALMVRILSEFGFTPRAAMSMKSHNSQKQDDDPIMALLSEN